MKRKFFSMMVAACAALFSFTGLTGCSGGSGEDDTYGVITLEQFETGSKYFCISLGGRYVNIIPLTSDGSQTQIPGGNIELNDPRQTGSRMRECMIGNAMARVRYDLNVWPANAQYPSDGTPDSANSNRLVIIFDATDNGGDDTALLKAFGLDAPLERLTSDINIGLKFASGTCDASYSISYTESGKPVPSTKAPTGSLIVVKR